MVKTNSHSILFSSIGHVHLQQLRLKPEALVSSSTRRASLLRAPLRLILDCLSPWRSVTSVSVTPFSADDFDWFCVRFPSTREINIDYSMDESQSPSDESADRRALHVGRSQEWYVRMSAFTINLEARLSVLEVRQDLTEYYEDKMQRVQRKLNNLRKLASSEFTLHLLLSRRLRMPSIEDEKTPDEKETTLFERLKLQVMQHLQITLRNLHISYETVSTTVLGHPFSFGLTICSLEMTVRHRHRSIVHD